MNFVRVDTEENGQYFSAWLDRTAVAMIQQTARRERCLVLLRDGTRLVVCLGFNETYALLVPNEASTT